MQGFWKGPSEPAEKRLTADLDFEQHTILVARSYERETTKGGHEGSGDAPIAKCAFGLAPYPVPSDFTTCDTRRPP